MVTEPLVIDVLVVDPPLVTLTSKEADISFFPNPSVSLDLSLNLYYLQHINLS